MPEVSDNASANLSRPSEITGWDNVWTAVSTRARCDFGILRKLTKRKVKEVAAILKAIHAQEDAKAAKGKAPQVVQKLRAMRLAKVAEIVENGIDETLSYYAVPAEYWRRRRPITRWSG